jgi:hypothetical protein
VIASTTASTNGTTGALVVRGGAGIGGNVNVLGNLFVNSTGVTTPGAATISASAQGVGANISPATYYVYVLALDGYGQLSAVGPISNSTVVPSTAYRIDGTWTAVPNAVNYYVYFSVSPGTTFGFIQTATNSFGYTNTNQLINSIVFPTEVSLGVPSTSTTTGGLVLYGGIGLNGSINARGTIIAGGNIVAAATTASTNTTTGALVVPGGAGIGGNVHVGGNVIVTGAVSAIGYGPGAGGAVTQLTSRSTQVAIAKLSGSITLFTAAGATTWTSFTVTNPLVAVTDTVSLSVRSATNIYITSVSNIANGSFVISFATTGGVVSDTPIINFNVIKGASV